MQFNLPTTKQEMYTILNELFHYYRVRREGFEEIALTELHLERLSYTPPSDDDIAVKAEKLVAAEKAREKTEYVSDLNSQIIELTEKIAFAEINAEEEIKNVEELYEKSIETIAQKASNVGVHYSSIIVDKTAALLDSKNKSVAKITAKKNDTVTELSAKKQALEQKLSGVDDYFRDTHSADTEKKKIELMDERETLMREIFKYNNGLDEKEQRYRNTIKQTNASLKLRFLDISSGEFSKDQLVEMGYYEDVVNCVCGYYDRLDSATAFQDIGSEKKLAIYLDDYYQDVVYMYSLLA